MPIPESLPPAEQPEVSYRRFHFPAGARFVAGMYLMHNLYQVASGAWDSVGIGEPPAVTHTAHEIIFETVELTPLEQGLHGIGQLAVGVIGVGGLLAGTNFISQHTAARRRTGQ